MINVFQPALADEELAAIQRVFASNWVGRGAVTEEFEAAFADFQGVEPCQMCAVNCATEGLFQAIALLDVGPGDEVILPTIGFVGAANAIAASGARPMFCDVDGRTLNATVESIEAQITPRTRAVLLLHYGGVPCDMAAICELLQANGIPLVEDSACSVASRDRDRACGTFGDIGIWSFDAMKILVTGDGGMVFCRHPELRQRLDKLVYLGLEQESGFSSPDRDRWWEFEIAMFGRRAIMNDIAAAVGLEQLAKLPNFIARRRQVHEAYGEGLASLAGRLTTPPPLPAEVESSYYFYWVQTSPDLRDRLARYLREQDIYTTFRYYPLHRVRRYGSDASLPQAEMAAESTLCLPIHQSLTGDDVTHVIAGIHRFFDDPSF